MYLSYPIVFWLTSGIAMHINCFNSATGTNTTRKTMKKQNKKKQHIFGLFSDYLPLSINPPIFNMGSMLTG